MCLKNVHVLDRVNVSGALQLYVVPALQICLALISADTFL